VTGILLAFCQNCAKIVTKYFCSVDYCISVVSFEKIETPKGISSERSHGDQTKFSPFTPKVAKAKNSAKIPNFVL